MTIKTFEHDPEQEKAIRLFTETEHSAALNGSGTGVGKTVCAVTPLVNRNAKRVLIIAPPSTFENWQATLKTIGSQELLVCANAKTAGISAVDAKRNLEACQAGADGWFFVSRELFNRQNWKQRTKGGKPVTTSKGRPSVSRMDVWCKRRQFDAAVFDEVQMCSDKDARTRQSWANLNAGFKIAQSADWFGTNLENMYTVTDDLWPGFTGMNRAEWIDEYLTTEFDPFTYNKKRVTGEQWPGFFATTLPCYVAIPSPIDKPVPEKRWVDMLPAQRKLYDKLAEDMAAEIDGDVLVVEMPMTLTMRLKELALGLFRPVDVMRKSKEGEEVPGQTIAFDPGAPSAKIDEIKSIMRDHPGEPIIILTSSQKFAVKAAIDLGGLPYTGAQTPAEKDENVAAFIRGDVKVLVGTEAMSEGLDGLQHVCHIGIIASRVSVPYKNTQFLGRIARRGQEKPVIAYELVARDTVDADIVHNSIQRILQNNQAKAIQKKKEAQ